MSVKVGKSYEVKVVSDLNHKLFKEAEVIMEKSAGSGESLHHIGWYDVSKFIDHLEANYVITTRD